MYYPPYDWRIIHYPIRILAVIWLYGMNSQQINITQLHPLISLFSLTSA